MRKEQNEYIPVPHATAQPIPMECDLLSEKMIRDTGITADKESQDEVRTCRICLETDNPRSMIAPCQCKGTSKWVHRDCLDEWRVHEEDRAFSQCTECNFQYHFEDTSHMRRKLQTRFCLFVSRDICLVTIVVQILILLLAWVVRAVDVSSNEALLHFLSQKSVSSQREAIAIYYACGFIGLFVVLGVSGSIVLCKNKCRVRDVMESYSGSSTTTIRGTNVSPTNDEEINGLFVNSGSTYQERGQFYQQRRRRRREHYPLSCCDCCCAANECCTTGGPNYYYGPYYYGSGSNDDCCCCCCCGENRNGGGDCYCPTHHVTGAGHHHGNAGGNSGDQALHVLLVLLLVVIIVMAIIGFVVGIFLSILVTQRIIQRHVLLLEKRRLVDDFPVKDLSGYDLVQSSALPPLQEQTEDPLNGSIYKASPVPPPRTSLQPDEASHLKKLGLLD